MTARAGLSLASIVALALAMLVGTTVAAQAQDEVSVPTTPGETVTVEWEGTVLPGANPSSECGQPTDVGADAHNIDLIVPDGTSRGPAR